MPTKRTDDDAQLRASLMGAKTPAEFARIIGKPGKSVRDTLRRHGVYVSRGVAFDDTVKGCAIAHYLDADADAWHALDVLRGA